MNKESLQATLVMVHPDLKNDPLQNQGKIAVVNYDRQIGQDLYLGFLDGREGVYHPAELLKLKKKDEVMKELAENGTSMQMNDFKNLYKIMLLQDRGTPQAIHDALEIARDHRGIWDRALEAPGMNRGAELSAAFNR
jgi:hypothetical protein